MAGTQPGKPRMLTQCGPRAPPAVLRDRDTRAPGDRSPAFVRVVNPRQGRAGLALATERRPWLPAENLRDEGERPPAARRHIPLYSR